LNLDLILVIVLVKFQLIENIARFFLVIYLCHFKDFWFIRI